MRLRKAGSLLGLGVGAEPGRTLPAAWLKAARGPPRQRGMKQRRTLRIVTVAGQAAVPRVVPGA